MKDEITEKDLLEGLEAGAFRFVRHTFGEGFGSYLNMFAEEKGAQIYHVTIEPKKRWFRETEWICEITHNRGREEITDAKFVCSPGFMEIVNISADKTEELVHRLKEEEHNKIVRDIRKALTNTNQLQK